MTAIWFVLSGIFAFILGIAVMALMQIAGSSELRQEKEQLKSIVDEMTGDWLSIFVQSKEPFAKGIAKRWVGKGGELERNNFN